MKRALLYVAVGDVICILPLLFCLGLFSPDRCFSADNPVVKKPPFQDILQEQQKTSPAPDRPVPPQLISVDFDKAQLSELVLMVSEFTGSAFVFDDDIENPVTWSQRDIPKDELVSTFIDVVTSLGYTVSRIEGFNDFWSIKSDPTLSAGSMSVSSGTYTAEDRLPFWKRALPRILHGRQFFQKLSLCRKSRRESCRIE
ncbi:MAG: hypothetical protein D3914_10105, partial [Candidatus Electrothrix sp. LOE2]|nr:hypothetical protein [Candidatus Electrothrix sp. LOE2]